MKCPIPGVRCRAFWCPSYKKCRDDTERLFPRKRKASGMKIYLTIWFVTLMSFICGFVSGAKLFNLDSMYFTYGVGFVVGVINQLVFNYIRGLHQRISKLEKESNQRLFLLSEHKH